MKRPKLTTQSRFSILLPKANSLPFELEAHKLDSFIAFIPPSHLFYIHNP